MQHALSSGVKVELPVPIELIIEQTYGLEILWDDIREAPGTILLGALSPIDRRIVLNSRHESLFYHYMGPERFTLAHELAHWIYDADDPDQMALGFEEKPSELYCYWRDSPGISDIQQIREINANKLAAHLLLPEELVRSANINEVLSDLPATAMKWQVSQTALRIRLQELGLVRPHNSA